MLFSVIPLEEPSISSIAERSHSTLVKMLFTPAIRKRNHELFNLFILINIQVTAVACFSFLFLLVIA